MAKDISNLQDRALLVFAYLTAGRSGEIAGTVKKVGCQYMDSGGRSILLITMPNLKNRVRKQKQLPIPLDKEGELVAMLQEYLDLLSDENILFPFCSRTAREKMKSIVGFDIRYMRHVRATHLVTMYDFNEQLLVRFMGWTDSRPAKYYMELRWVDFLSKM